jgi:hypothetical protein
MSIVNGNEVLADGRKEKCGGGGAGETIYVYGCLWICQYKVL